MPETEKRDKLWIHSEKTACRWYQKSTLHGQDDDTLQREVQQHQEVYGR